MHEPDIAPLARRLAEENNVDWRRLAGTGEDGRVVERDVLGYLARVMAGEEAVDPTPEPVPEGMAAWPADDVGRYGTGDEDVDEPTSPPTLDDDLFLFEAPAPAEAGDADDALFVGADVDEPYREAVAREAGVPEEDGHVIETPGAGEGEADDGVWLVGDDGAEGDEAGEWAAEPRAPGVAAAAEPDDGDVMRLDELPDLTGFDDEMDAHASDDQGARLAGGRDALELPDLFSDERDAHDDATAAHDALALEADDVPGGWDAGAAADDLLASPVAASPAPEAAAVPAVAGAVRGDGELAAAPGPAQPAMAVSLVRHGQLWRRRIDDRVVRQVASDAAAALDVAPTTVVLLLLARAASRAGVADGSVDAWRWRRDGADRLPIDPDAAVREAARRIEVRGERDDAPPASLVVADLGSLDVDEAVLHLDAPVLALGRSSADGAWLSLSGDDLDAGAASGLARIAELLGSPVRLLL
ncbi:MAG: E3 binding domain-containing protein [Trueperaceae bacterium]|nr:E3 binding domain-containing protein [Trueperaceae bacterium]